MYFAHSLQGRDQAEWQVLHIHLKQVAGLAATRARKFRAHRLAALIGELHDLGKYSREFQGYIVGGGASVDHATAGAQEVMRLVPSVGKDRIAALIAAYCIAGHHAGLPNWCGERPLRERLTKNVSKLDPLWRKELVTEATDLFPTGFEWIEKKDSFAFQLAMLGRMLFSCLVDADFRDTESFYFSAEGKTVDRDWPLLAHIVDDLTARFDAHMARTAAAASGAPLGSRRAGILAHARSKAGLSRGVFTLDVPTGGGKTLASLGFALDHAKAHGMDRIVYGIPFTSIIDQTVEIFREVLGNDVVLAHHSAIEEEHQDCKPENEEGESDLVAKMRLAMEDWAAPVVVTTNVQLFESLFASRTSRCRKLHNLVNSVIILDEAQTMAIPLAVFTVVLF